MDWAPQLDFLWQIVEDDGKVPTALATQPKLAEHLGFAWQAFNRLNGDRAISEFGQRPIPFSSIDAYARRFGIDDRDDFDRFCDLIRALDAAFLNWKPPDDG